MTNAVSAARHGTPTPSLLPEVKVAQEQVINASNSHFDQESV